MIRAATPRVPASVRLAALVAVGILYLATRQHTFSIDSLYYLWDTEFGDWTRLWHPHHLALQPVLRGVWRLFTWFAWPDRAVLPLQLWNVAVSLGALALLWRLLTRLVASRGLAATWWGVFAVSYLPWSQATQAEGVPLYGLFATALLLTAARLPDAGVRPTRRTALGVAALLAGAVLLHQSLVLWAPAVAWMVGREAEPGRRWHRGALTLGVAGLLVLACYVAAGAWTTGSLAPGVLWRWFVGYSEEFAGRCGQLANLVSADVPRGLALSFLTGAPLKAYVFGDRGLDAAFVARAAPFAFVAAVLAAGLLLLPRVVRAAPAPRRRALLHVALLTVIGALFAGWWEPLNRKFWTPVLPGLVALAAVGWASLDGRGRRGALVAAALTAAVLLGYNLGGGVLPRHHHHDARQPLLAFLTRHVQPGDAVVLQEDRVWQAAIYFRPDQTVHGIPGPFSDRDDPQHTVLRAALADARRALATGHTLYVADHEWPLIRDHLREDLGPLPEPEVVLRYGDWELGAPAQLLLAVRWPVG